MRKGQSYSLDVVLAVVIFGFVSVVFASVALLDRPDVEDLQINAESVVARLESFDDCEGVLVRDALNSSAVSCLYAKNYTDIKKDLDLKGDFCIYLEDEAGRLIQIEGADGSNRTSWGSNELEIGGTPCGQ